LLFLEFDDVSVLERQLNCIQMIIFRHKMDFALSSFIEQALLIVLLHTLKDFLLLCFFHTLFIVVKFTL